MLYFKEGRARNEELNPAPEQDNEEKSKKKMSSLRYFSELLIIFHRLRMKNILRLPNNIFANFFTEYVFIQT